MAFEVGGVPTTTLVGTDEKSLSWTVNHAPNAQLMLGMVDSNGSSGGIPPKLYSVVTGQSMNCLVNPTNPTAFTVTSNLTGSVTTCQPWGLTIRGGVPPYTVTLAARNSPIVTNVTLGPADDAFTYIDRADPDTDLIAAVSDFTGRFASGTPLVKTRGSPIVDCIGLVSSSGNSTIIKQQADAAAAAVRAHKRKTITIGVCVTLAGLIIIAGTILVVLYKRRRQQEHDRETAPDTAVRQYEERDEGQILTIPPSTHHNPHSPKTPRTFPESSASSSVLISSNYAGAPAFDPYQSTRDSGISSRPPSSPDPSSHRPVSSGYTARRSQKAIEAGLSSPQSIDSSLRPGSADSRAPLTVSRSESVQASGSGPSSQGNTRWPTRSESLQAGVVDPNTNTPLDDIIYQHRDGGGVVRELPPPYADRNAPPAQ
jgi:hypothetical protein